MEEFIIANCEYPNKWQGKVERIEQKEDLIITATHVFSIDESMSFHVVSFIRIVNDKIISLDEYWGDDGTIPQWRQEKNLGNNLLNTIKMIEIYKSNSTVKEVSTP